MKTKIYILVIICLFCFLSEMSYTQCLNSETEFKNYFDKNINTLDPIEGIWSESYTTYIYKNGEIVSAQQEVQEATDFAIMKDGNKFILCALKGDVNQKKKEEFTSTAANGIYLYKGTYTNTGNIDKANAVLTDGVLLEYNVNVNMNQIEYDTKYTKSDLDGKTLTIKHKAIKTYPNKQSTEKKQKSSGTGFAISSIGYIATCNHVVDGASSLKVKGIGGNFTTSYTAKVISTDPNNDLAIIKIDDPSFTNLSTLPYTISSITNDVGSNIFILGYPLTATMGDEIKLTDGIISAKSGFKGDITSYQISAAAQPGNSGGPLFDKNGNLIGVVNAKYIEAENATYAVKSTYLKNLIDALTTTITLPTVNSLTGKALTDQVKEIKNFVYIIEVN
jgi:S1-C subfamily serine protease